MQKTQCGDYHIFLDEIKAQLMGHRAELEKEYSEFISYLKLNHSLKNAIQGFPYWHQINVWYKAFSGGSATYRALFSANPSYSDSRLFAAACKENLSAALPAGFPGWIIEEIGQYRGIPDSKIIPVVDRKRLKF